MISRLSSLASPCTSTLKSVLLTMRSVSRTISSPRSMTSPSRQEAAISSAYWAITLAYATILACRNIGIISLRCRWCSSCSLTSRPLPTSGRSRARLRSIRSTASPCFVRNSPASAASLSMTTGHTPTLK